MRQILKIWNEIQRDKEQIIVLLSNPAIPSDMSLPRVVCRLARMVAGRI